MLIFASGEGRLTVVPSQLNQNSNGANTVYLTGAFPSASVVTVAFTLPDGTNTEPQLMTGDKTVEYNGVTLAVKEYTLPKSITQIYGRVTVQFYIQNGTEVLATEATNITVAKGVPSLTPDLTPSVYEQILAALSSINTNLVTEVAGFVDDPSKTYLVVSGANVRIRFDPATAPKATIDWGDGNTEVVSVTGTTETVIQHTYADIIEYHRISIKGLENIGTRMFYNLNNLVRVSIANTVKTISGSAFYYCSRLTSIFIPDSVTSISVYAFRWCTALKNILIPESVTYIGDTSFDGCTALKNIVIPDSVTYLGSYAFSGCTALIGVVISANVSYIRDATFSGCTKLETIQMRRTTPPTLVSGAIPSTIKKIVVPKSSISQYKSTGNWRTFSSKIIYDIDSSELTDYPKKTDFKAVTQGRFYLNANEGLTIEPYSVYYIQCFDSSNNLADLTCVGSGKTVKGRFVFLITGGYLSNGVPDSLAIIQTGSIVISELVKTDANITSITPSSGNHLVYFKQGGKALKN